jgi:hypothetical protein
MEHSQDMSLDLSIRETITCDAVVEIATKAAEVILAIYDSKVRVGISYVNTHMWVLLLLLLLMMLVHQL